LWFTSLRRSPSLPLRWYVDPDMLIELEPPLALPELPVDPLLADPPVPVAPVLEEPEPLDPDPDADEPEPLPIEAFARMKSPPDADDEAPPPELLEALLEAPLPDCRQPVNVMF